VLRACRFAVVAVFSGFLSLPVFATPAMEISTQVQAPLLAIYEARQFAPLWLVDGKPTARASQAIELMGKAADDALDPADYPVAELQKQRDTLQQTPGDDRQQAAFDLAMSRAMARYVEHLSIGRVMPGAVDIGIDMAPQMARLPQHLQQVLTADDLPAALAGARPHLPPYAALRELLPVYRQLAQQHPQAPALPPLPGKKLEPGNTWEGVGALSDWLIVLGDLPVGTPVPPLYEGALVDGMKHFQMRHGLTPDGVIGKQSYQSLQVSLPQRVQQIELTMERLRWLDDSIVNQRFIGINIPQFTLWAFAPVDGAAAPVLTMPVVVGQAGKTETPVLAKTLSTLVFSPYWNVPRSITKKEILPKLRKDPGYLAHEHMELVGSNGAIGSHVGPDELNGIIMGGYRIRQTPGSHNALGTLKFVFPNDDSIYMHDTPSKKLFAKERRDFSHGCVRVGNPMALALFVLQTQGEWDEAKVQQKIDVGSEQQMPLRERIPVLLMYFTASVAADGTAVFLQDIYNKDAKLVTALSHRA
jgi:murein L,D-transpeptidase YcbB/YkuD